MAQSGWKEYFDNKASTHGGSVMTSDYFNEKSFYTQRENTLNWLGNIEGKKILDAGCGVGAFSETLVGKNEVYGVDFSEKSLAFAAKRGLNPYCGDLGHLPFENGNFDLCLCIGVIQLIPEYKKVLAELTRVVKPGGTLLIETLNGDSLLRKIYGMINKDKKFDLMFAKRHMKAIFEELGYRDIEFLTLYQPFTFSTKEKEPGVFDKHFGTSFAIKGVKK